MADITSLGTPVTLAAVGSHTRILDNFTGASPVGGTVPPISPNSTAWLANANLTTAAGVITGVDGSGIQDLQMALGHSGSSGFIIDTPAGATQPTMDVGYRTPNTTPPNAFGGYFYISGRFQLGANVNIFWELIRIYAPQQIFGLNAGLTGSSGLVQLVRDGVLVTLGNFNTTLTGIGTWGGIYGYDLNNEKPYRANPTGFASGQLSSDLGLSSAYKITAAVDPLGFLTLAINDVVYLSAPFTYDKSSANDIYTARVTNNLSCYIGSGFTTNGLDSVRVNGDFSHLWGGTKNATEKE